MEKIIFGAIVIVAVLITIVKLANNPLPENDWGYHTVNCGGQEYVILLPDTSKENLEELSREFCEVNH